MLFSAGLHGTIFAYDCCMQFLDYRICGLHHAKTVDNLHDVKLSVASVVMRF